VTWAVFLDRDGVLTEATVIAGRAGSPRGASDLRILPRSAAAITRLRRFGALVFVVTNQPDIARGALDQTELEAMHVLLRRELTVDDVRVCPHDATERCACRKPLPGMLTDLARQWKVTLGESWMVGDRWVDVAAGATAGVKTILVERPYSWLETSAGPPPSGLEPDHRVRDVAEAVDVIERARRGTAPSSPAERNP
jgi:D-glycero-D-manno-heptose 1,7-bisphosphate phosphatase